MIALAYNMISHDKCKGDVIYSALEELRMNMSKKLIALRSAIMDEFNRRRSRRSR
jgi:hypothetical protein